MIQSVYCWSITLNDAKSIRLMQIAEELTAMGIHQDVSNEDGIVMSSVALSETDLTPYLNRPTKRMLNSHAKALPRKDTELCKEHGCCAHDFVIDLSALGYNSIIEPTVLNVGICYNMIGKCPKALYERNGVPALRGTSCLADNFEPVTISYLDEDNERIPQPLSRMIITNCTCN
ncbi:hypothetical protein WR25_16870 [Diploscapter pachys]|uniref:TGF-beta family profile domain-containing protein n=1 Tax=Diploscapter pachys TaxID=2018661 RepID=A0A2A2LDW3_9BILA|nr:hypothetical protein WR25_16870 [Diploscapter pachys]